MRLIISRTDQLQSAEERNGKINNKIEITATHIQGVVSKNTISVISKALPDCFETLYIIL